MKRMVRYCIFYGLLMVSFLATAQQLDPRSQQEKMQFLYNNAFTSQKEYRPNDAMKSLRMLLIIDSNFIPAYNLMGYVYEDAYVQYDSALACYQKTIALDSNYVKGYVNIGHIYFLKKQYDEAMYYNQRALEVDSNYADAYFNQGWIYNVRGDLKQSLLFIRKAARKGSSVAIGWLKKNGYEVEDI